MSKKIERRSKKHLLSSAATRFPPVKTLMMVGTAASAIVFSAPREANAFDLYSGNYGGQDLEINLNTTVQYSTTYRVNGTSAILLNNVNGDEGDRNFRHGFVDNTFNVLPVFDLQYGNFGAHLSGEAYIDTPYLGKNQNNSPSTFNPSSTTDNRSFTSATRNVNGENARLLDAFIYDGINFGAGNNQTLTLKIGRQTLFWGQSLFFASNGISAGQAPLDIVKALNLPNAESQQIFMPVGQVVLTYSPNPELTFQGYYQFEWEHDYFEGVGAYFNSSDLLDKGGQRLLLGQAYGVPPQDIALYRAKDLSPPIENGQFGASVQTTVGIWDLGLYALRYDAKGPEIYAGPIVGPAQPGQVGSYWLVYPRDIQIYGASFSTNFLGANVAGEVAGRRNMNLVAGGLGNATVYPSGANAANGNSNGTGALYPVGSVLTAQASAIYVEPGMRFIPGGISYDAEVAMNHLISVDANRAALAQGRQATAAAFQAIITPAYYSVLPKLDITFPIGIAYNFLGRSEMSGNMNHGTGTFNVGVSATYRTTWIAALTYQEYLGKPDPSLNPTADRGYVNFNIQHTF